MAAPTEFTVQTIVKREEWEGNDGPMVTYELLLADESQIRKGHVPLAKDPKPQEGQTVEGWADTAGKFGFATGKGKGGSRGGGKTFERQPDHPLNMARALHTSSITSAPVLIEQMLTMSLKDVQQPKTKAEYLNLVAGVAEWIRNTYPQEVLAQAEPKQAELPSNGGDPAPAAKADDKIPF